MNEDQLAANDPESGIGVQLYHMWTTVLQEKGVRSDSWSHLTAVDREAWTELAMRLGLGPKP